MKNMSSVGQTSVKRNEQTIADHRNVNNSGQKFVLSPVGHLIFHKFSIICPVKTFVTLSPKSLVKLVTGKPI